MKTALLITIFSILTSFATFKLTNQINEHVHGKELEMLRKQLKQQISNNDEQTYIIDSLVDLSVNNWIIKNKIK